MIKTVALIARRPDVDRETFRDHYENVHAPLALPHLRGIVRYARNHVVETLAGEPPAFACASEFWWRDGRAIAALLAHLETDAAAEIRRDEETFMDRARNGSFAVRDATLGVELRPAAAAKVLALGRRRVDEDAETFLARWRDASIPVLIASLGAPLDVQHDAAVAGTSAPWDCATWIWLSAAPGPVGAWRPDAANVCAVRVTERVSPIGP